MAALALPAQAAYAQPDDEEGDTPSPDDSVDDLLSETESDDGSPIGVDENPDAPKTGQDNKGVQGAASEAATDVYPIQIVRRPITLAAGMAEVALETPTNISPFFASGILRASYGINRQVQLDLQYGAGTYSTDGYSTGKTVAINVTYLLTDILALQFSVPVLVDPLAFGLTVGAPLKYRLSDTIALEAGRDLFTLKLKTFIPIVGNAVTNEALVESDRLNESMPYGVFTINGGVLVQHADNLVFTGNIGIASPEFSDSTVSAYVGAIHSISNKLDVGGKLGFADMDTGTDSFGLQALVTLRI